MEQAFRMGARGFLVENIQLALGVLPDGVYGRLTAQAVEKYSGSPQADCDFFEAAGIPWPGEFEICLNLCSVLEGTSFGDCNTSDIDGAGLTFGCCGFTTEHGEVQLLLRRLFQLQPGAAGVLERASRQELEALCASEAKPAEWKQFFFPDGKRVSQELQRALLTWGENPLMQALQVEFARQRFWEPACRCAEQLGLISMSARGMLLDTWIQNGGISRQEIQSLRIKHLSEAALLSSLPGLISSRAKARWRADVLARKNLFARGAGDVHSTHFSLAAQAFSL
jgi:hypothetical protein